MPPDITKDWPSLKLLFQILIELFKLEKPPKRSDLESKFLCSMMWIATGLIPSSVNWAFKKYRKIREKLWGTSRYSYFISFSISDTFWVIFWVILWVILAVRLQKPIDYLRQTWYHCSFGFTRKSLKCLAVLN